MHARFAFAARGLYKSAKKSTYKEIVLPKAWLFRLVGYRPKNAIQEKTKVSGCVGASRRKVANERVVRGKT